MDFTTWITRVAAELNRRTGNGDLYVDGYLDEFRAFYAAGKSVEEAVRAALSF